MQEQVEIPEIKPVHVQGISYFAISGVDKDFFRCRARQATLSSTACATMWKEAQVAKDRKAERLEVCRLCPIGAAHAGEEIVTRSRLYGSMICPRCRRGTTRMIDDRRCVSCYNREREILAGKNAKGTAPVKLGPLFPIELNYLVDGKPRRYHARLARDLLEPMVSILRLTKGRVGFAFTAKFNFRQGRLF